MGGSGGLGIGMRTGMFRRRQGGCPRQGRACFQPDVLPPRTVPAGVTLADPPIVVDFSAPNDSWSIGHDAFVKAMNERRYSIFFYWGPFGHEHNYERIRKVNDLINSFDWLSVRKNDAYPVFSGASTNDPLPWPDRLADKKPGQVNAFFRWKTVRDTADAVEVAFPHQALGTQDHLYHPGGSDGGR